MEALFWLSLGLLPLYFIPGLRIASTPFRTFFDSPEAKHSPPSALLLWTGRVEYLLGPLRDRLLSPLLLLGVLYQSWQGSAQTGKWLFTLWIVILLNGLSVLSQRHRRQVQIQLAEIARTHSNIHPRTFFQLYYEQLSLYPGALPKKFPQVSYHEADYRTGEPPKLQRSLLLGALLSTATLARMATLAFKKVGPDFGRDAFDGLARLWGSRIAYLFQARLRTSFMEKIPPMQGKTLLVFNHKSSLDFVLNFFAMGDLYRSEATTLGPQTRHLRPRFIAAKDHFIDNPLFYSWIGVGKVIENAGMVFINRKKKGMGWKAMEEAAEKLVTTDVEIAIYPQGTRAYALQSLSGQRQDAGFYTTFTKRTWDQPFGHLKPGTAHLILDTLIQLKAQGEAKLNVLITGILGVGVTGPKGNWVPQTQTDIEYRVSPVWTLSTQWVEGIQKPQSRDDNREEVQAYWQRLEEVQQGLNDRLVQAMDWHNFLKAKALQALKDLKFSEAHQQTLQEMLSQADAQGELRPYILLDRILSLKTDQWKRFFSLLLAPKDPKEPERAWRDLLQEVSENLLKG